MLFARLAETSRAVAAVPGRTRKLELLSERLREAASGEVEVVVAYLSGELPQRRTGVGYAALRDLPPPAPAPALEVLAVHRSFARLAAVTGSGSAAERQRQVQELFAQATAPEQDLLAGLVAGELRQGAQAGLLVDAVARAAGVPRADVRRALTLRGALGLVAVAALTEGAAGLARFGLRVGQGVAPMLAQPAADLADAMARTGPAAVEWKLDGVRIQVHRDGGQVRVFTRTLDDVTPRVPELVAAALALPVRSVVLDGEAVALRPDGRPHRFQVTASRLATRSASGTGGGIALTPYLFDLLHLDGVDLLGEPLAVRVEALDRVVPERLRTPRLVTTDLAAAQGCYDEALRRGHEGVVVKALSSSYEAGRRGGAWRKVKPRHTLDLLVLAAEWGHGRRRGRLSNLHLGVRDPGAAPVMLGKTFKGLTDVLLEWQTERLLALEVRRELGLVVVRPELVVEVAFDGVQTSSRYPGGVALRFARVLRYREDKPPEQADTIEDVRRIHAG